MQEQSYENDTSLYVVLIMKSICSVNHEVYM